MRNSDPHRALDSIDSPPHLEVSPAVREQDAIVTDVRSARGSSRKPPVLLQFFAKENGKTWSDPATRRSGASRGPEIPSRQVWLE